VVHSGKAGLVIHVNQAVLVVLSAKVGLVVHVVHAVLVVTKPAFPECTT
jgi:hypothetical protein